MISQLFHCFYVVNWVQKGIDLVSPWRRTWSCHVSSKALFKIIRVSVTAVSIRNVRSLLTRTNELRVCIYGVKRDSFRFVNALTEFNLINPPCTTQTQGRKSAMLDRMLQIEKTKHKKDLNHFRHFTILYKVRMVYLRLVPLMFARG